MKHHRYGTASLVHLSEGSEPLQKWAFLTLELSAVDISCVDCGRTEEEQRQNILDGVSWTMDSDHLIKLPDRPRPEAVDLYPWVDGRTSLSLRHYKLIARAGFIAAVRLDTVMIWGGHWKEENFDPAHWARHRDYR